MSVRVAYTRSLRLTELTENTGGLIFWALDASPVSHVAANTPAQSSYDRPSYRPIPHGPSGSPFPFELGARTPSPYRVEEARGLHTRYFCSPIPPCGSPAVPTARRAIIDHEPEEDPANNPLCSLVRPPGYAQHPFHRTQYRYHQDILRQVHIAVSTRHGAAEDCHSRRLGPSRPHSFLRGSPSWRPRQDA